MNSISWVPIPGIGLGVGEAVVSIMGEFLVPAKCRVLSPPYPVSFLPPSEGICPTPSCWSLFYPGSDLPYLCAKFCCSKSSCVLFFNCFYFNWRLITLQQCSGFCHTFTWINRGCTCVPHPEPPSPSHPSGSSQCTSPEHPVSCIEPGLVIYFTYGNIHVSGLFSQIIPPSPSPIESNSLFFTSVSLLLPCI